MRILITGKTGQVGQELARRAPAFGFDLTALARAELDLADAASVRSAVDAHRPDLVVNAAAYTAVDLAEKEQELAFAANRDGPAAVAAACAARGIPMIHFSTDYVFDGAGGSGRGGGYREEDATRPLGVYGASKLAGEEAVRAALAEHLILRVSWVFSPFGKNFVKTMLRLAAERDELRVVADQRGGPTAAGDIAQAALTVAQRIDSKSPPAWGTYHFAGAPATNWHGFAEQIVTEGRKHKELRARRVVPITTAEYPTPAARPRSSIFDCSRIRAALAIEQPSWEAALRTIVAEICASG